MSWIGAIELCTPVLFENGGADMLLITSNTRSGGVGQGRASLARRIAVGAQRRALTDAGAEGIPPQMPVGLCFQQFPLRDLQGSSIATFQTRFSLSYLIPLWFPHSNLKLLRSSHSG